MKLKIKQNILMNYLNYAIRGVSSKNLIPILNCIKFELKEEGLYLTSTDNEISIKTLIKMSKIDKTNKSWIGKRSREFESEEFGNSKVSKKKCNSEEDKKINI